MDLSEKINKQELKLNPAIWNPVHKDSAAAEMIVLHNCFLHVFIINYF